MRTVGPTAIALSERTVEDGGVLRWTFGSGPWGTLLLKGAAFFPLVRVTSRGNREGCIGTFQRAPQQKHRGHHNNSRGCCGLFQGL